MPRPIFQLTAGNLKRRQADGRQEGGEKEAGEGGAGREPRG
jgi:hypothetical protein